MGTGAVLCWGDNNDGQLGVTTPGQSSTPPHRPRRRLRVGDRRRAEQSYVRAHRHRRHSRLLGGQLARRSRARKRSSFAGSHGSHGADRRAGHCRGGRFVVREPHRRGRGVLGRRPRRRTRDGRNERAGRGLACGCRHADGHELTSDRRGQRPFRMATRAPSRRVARSSVGETTRRGSSATGPPRRDGRPSPSSRSRKLRRRGYGRERRAFRSEGNALDAVFLDIEMPGIDLARRIAPGPRIVFVTAYDTFALQAFEVSAVDLPLEGQYGRQVVGCNEPPVTLRGSRARHRLLSRERLDFLLAALLTPLARSFRGAAGGHFEPIFSRAQALLRGLCAHVFHGIEGSRASAGGRASADPWTRA